MEHSVDHTTKPLYKVDSVESPEIVSLESFGKIRLLGIRTNPFQFDKAMRFLERATAETLVFMNQDKLKSDETGLPLAYLYREDGTFLNALLVKYDLVDVDERTPFKYKERFLKRQRDNRTNF